MKDMVPIRSKIFGKAPVIQMGTCNIQSPFFISAYGLFGFLIKIHLN